MSDAELLAAVGTFVALTALLSWPILRVLRRRSYRHWSAPARWPFLAVVGLLVVLGAYVLVGLYLERWGLAATVWMLGAPFVYGAFSGREKPTA